MRLFATLPFDLASPAAIPLSSCPSCGLLNWDVALIATDAMLRFLQYAPFEEESVITAQINATLAQPMTEEEAAEEAAAEAFVAEVARRRLADWEWTGDRSR